MAEEGGGQPSLEEQFGDTSLSQDPTDKSHSNTTVELLNTRAAQGDKAFESKVKEKEAKKKIPQGSTMFPQNGTKFLTAAQGQLPSLNAYDGMISDIYKAKSKIMSGLNVRGTGDYKNAVGKLINGNSYSAEGALGIFSNAYCGDGEGDVGLALHKLSKALDMNLNKVDAYNVCGRKAFVNPLEGIIKTVKRLESGLEELINLPGKMLNDLMDLASRTIDKLGLPGDLSQCLNDKVLKKFKLGNFKSPIGLAKKLERVYNAKICASSQEGIKGDSKILNKAVASPIVESCVTFDSKTMLAFATALINSPTIDNNILAEVLVESITDKANSNVINTLTFLAFVKATKEKPKPKPGKTISSVNVNLQKVEDSDKKVLDSILTANETGVKIDPNKVIQNAVTTTVVEEANSVSSSVIKAETILAAMRDDVAECKDVEAEYDNIIRLIKVADSTFKPDELIYKLFANITIATLALSILNSRICNSNESYVEEQYNVGGDVQNVTFRKVDDTLDLKTKVGILSVMNKDNSLISAV